MQEISENDETLDLIELLQEINKLSLLPDDSLAELITHGKLRQYEEGEVVIREGEYDCWVYILVKGRLAVIKDKKMVSQLCRTGDIFGEMGIIDASPRSATIKASSQSLILGFDASLIDQKLRSNELSFCYVLFRLFSEILSVRLRNTTEENIQLRNSLARFRPN